MTRQQHRRYLGDRALRRTTHRNGKWISFHKTNRKEPQAAAKRRSFQTQPQVQTRGSVGSGPGGGGDKVGRDREELRLPWAPSAEV